MLENNYEKSEKIITISLIGIIVLLLVIVGITYAYFSAKSTATEQSIKTAKVGLIVEVNPAATHVENIKPTTWTNTEDAKTNNDIVIIPIKVTNKSTIDINYDLFITPSGLSLNAGTNEDSQELVGGNLSDIKFKLYETTTGGETISPIKEGNFVNGDTKQKMVDNKEIKKEEIGKKDNIQTFMLYIYIAETNAEQNQLQGITFDLNVDGVTPSTKTLSEAILENEKGKIIEDEPTFTTESTDRGLFKLHGDIAESGKDIYYYKGAVTNNYVQFGTYTKDVINWIFNQESKKQVRETLAQKGDPMIWRIVRINEDGSIKLISEYSIGDSYHVWNSKKVSDYEGSDIKITVDTWYNETFDNSEDDCKECKNNKDLANLIQETEFCNDRSDEYKAVGSRLDSVDTPPQPTLRCARNEDKVRAKAGLITADELTYTGALYGKTVLSDNPTYLDNGTSFWTMSPMSSSFVIQWMTTSQLFAGMITDNTGVPAQARPVISIKADAPYTVNSNDTEHALGTKDNPWIIG